MRGSSNNVTDSPSSAVEAAAPPDRRKSLDDLRQEVEQLLERFESDFENWRIRPQRAPLQWFWGTKRGDYPVADVDETEQAFIITAELPGARHENVNVKMVDGYLIISGEEKTEKDESRDGVRVSERRYGSFERTFRLPDATKAETITARLERGLLIVIIPKSPVTAPKEHTIKIETGLAGL